MQKFMMLALAGICGFQAASAYADEIRVPAEGRNALFLNIYQQNLALVKSNHQVKMPDGDAVLAFEGVSQQIQPQTTLIEGKGITVLEKNYEYNLLSRENLLNAYVGKEIIAVTIDHETSKNMFDKAVLLNNDYGTPMLQFSYGIDPHFPGRIVFEKIPENLRNKPTLVAKVSGKGKEAKDISLSYLTGGLNWSGSYVAEITGKEKMNLQSWVEINNQSGTDYKDAKVSLVSGEVRNQANNGVVPQAKMLMATARMADYAAETASAEGGISAESLGEYYSYNLPQKIDVMNQQSKQVSLWSVNDAAYEKQYKIVSPLNNYSKMFEREHAAVVYKITNGKKEKLGRPMPAGIVRFYEKGADGNLTFTGAANMPQMAVGESAELNTGRSFDVYAGGKITNINKIAEKITETEYKISFFNAGAEEAEVIWEQKVNGETSIISDSADGKKTDAGLLQWRIKVPAGGKKNLEYKLRQTRD